MFHHYSYIKYPQQDKKLSFYISLLSLKLTIFFYLQNVVLSTLLILAECKICVIYEIHSGSVVEHGSVESEGLRFNSSWGLRIFSLFCAHEKMTTIFLNIQSGKIYEKFYYSSPSPGRGDCPL